MDIQHPDFSNDIVEKCSPVGLLSVDTLYTNADVVWIGHLTRALVEYRERVEAGVCTPASRGRLELFIAPENDMSPYGSVQAINHALRQLGWESVTVRTIHYNDPLETNYGKVEQYGFTLSVFPLIQPGPTGEVGPMGPPGKSELSLQPLQWSEVREPNDAVRYHHIIAETSLGRILITWKGWKDNDPPVIDEHPVVETQFQSFFSVAEAKAKAEKDLADAVLELFTLTPDSE